MSELHAYLRVRGRIPYIGQTPCDWRTPIFKVEKPAEVTVLTTLPPMCETIRKLIDDEAARLTKLQEVQQGRMRP